MLLISLFHLSIHQTFVFCSSICFSLNAGRGVGAESAFPSLLSFHEYKDQCIYSATR